MASSVAISSSTSEEPATRLSKGWDPTARKQSRDIRSMFVMALRSKG
jgi:hypothetical protein